MDPRINPIECILPPHILREISQRGNTSQRDRALRTLAVSERQRGRREAIGAFAFALATPAGEKRRTIYDAHNSDTLPGQLVRGEGDKPTGDPAADEAYDGLGSTYDLYKQIYNRNSIDNQGMRLDGTVHYQQNLDNAFWNGNQMVFGDGDGELFERFTKSVDVIGHELTHGVTQFTIGLVYKDQPGALNESISDVFGSLVKQRVLGQDAASADWLIGQGLFTPSVKGVALRSMKAPGTAYDDPVLGKDPQPAHMRDYQDVSYDNGGVHINSGIPNHAFYVTAVEIGGNAWEKAGMIWYVMSRDRWLQANASFQDAAAATYDIAAELYGTGSLEQQAVAKGWAEVGISVQPAASAAGA
ncbi:MAG TPA: M4 family metallopeptidase [Terriglobia bacterium]|nr:M4 family metallopeptidase [Terriglobia bacterium]